MHRGVVVALLLSGCHSVFGLEDPVLRSDAALDGTDAAPDAPDLCYGTAPAYCLQAPPASSVSLTGTLDTSSSPLCGDSVGSDVCLIAGTTITVEVGGVVVTGSRPIVLVALGAIALDGVVDVSSKIAAPARVGAGANDSTCASVDGTDNSSGGGGGAGGSFGTQGGTGGTGATGATGGLAALALPGAPSTLRGGCRGGIGGDGEVGSGGIAGASGGGVALISRSSISVAESGGVFASGAGGGAGDATGGLSKGAGGGGGSGGMIVLDAPVIDVRGTIAANGGGGGGGGDCCQGNPGFDGTTASYDTAAAGGPNEGAQHGGYGGRGAGGSFAAQAGLPPGSGGGGGGGGGGHGFVIVRGALTGTRISPAPVTP